MKYSVCSDDVLGFCDNIKDAKINSYYCTQNCEYCKNKTFENNINSFTCDYISVKRKEKLEKLKRMDIKLKDYLESENKTTIDRTYDNYFSDDIQKNDRYKKVFIDQIVLTATCSIVYHNCNLNDWIYKFKDVTDVLDELIKIISVYNAR